MSGEYTPRLPGYMPGWDEIETGYHEYASQVAQQEWRDPDPPHSFPAEFQDWREPMYAARRWLTAHDARIASLAAERSLRDAAEDMPGALTRLEMGCATTQEWLIAEADRIAAERTVHE